MTKSHTNRRKQKSSVAKVQSKQKRASIVERESSMQEGTGLNYDKAGEVDTLIPNRGTQQSESYASYEGDEIERLQHLRTLFDSVFHQGIDKVKQSKDSEDKRDILSNCYDELQGLLSLQSGKTGNADQVTELKKINLSVTRTNS